MMLFASIHDTECQFIKWRFLVKENVLVDLSKQFAVDVVNLCTEIKENRKSNVLLNQLLRSGTSVGANIHEANYASSKADFINKFQIALKECYETDYWLSLFKETNMITFDEYNRLFAQCSKIRKLLIASITTAKSNKE
jgi:four helix bundle protein